VREEGERGKGGGIERKGKKSEKFCVRGRSSNKLDTQICWQRGKKRN